MYSPIIIRAVQFATWPLHPPRGRILHSELTFEGAPSPHLAPLAWLVLLPVNRTLNVHRSAASSLSCRLRPPRCVCSSLARWSRPTLSLSRQRACRFSLLSWYEGGGGSGRGAVEGGSGGGRGCQGDGLADSHCCLGTRESGSGGRVRRVVMGGRLSAPSGHTTLALTLPPIYSLWYLAAAVVFARVFACFFLFGPSPSLPPSSLYLTAGAALMWLLPRLLPVQGPGALKQDRKDK